MTLKRTAKSLRSELIQKLIDVKGLSRSGARAVLNDIPQTPSALQLAIDDLDNQGLFLTGHVHQVGKFQHEQMEKVPYNFQIERGRLDALRAIAADDGASVSHHIRQAVADYLKKHVRR